MRLKLWLGLCALFLQCGSVYAGESQFASEELKLLGAEQSAIFTQQVLRVGHSTVIKAASPKSAYTALLDSAFEAFLLAY